MHQQLRVMLSTPSSTLDGSGAMAVVPIEVDPREVEAGALVRLLDLLAREGYNLRIAGGCGIETGGVFAFAIEDGGDANKASECAALLEKSGYRGVKLVLVVPSVAPFAFVNLTLSTTV